MQPNLVVEVWEENRTVLKVLLGDLMLFLIVLLGLALCFLSLLGLKRIGYPSERVALLETIHFWAYVCVVLLFVTDLIAKLLIFSLRRNNDRARG